MRSATPRVGRPAVQRLTLRVRSTGRWASGVGEATVRFQLACDPFTLDAERGACCVQVEPTDPPVDTCATYDLVVSSRPVLP